VQTNFTMKSSAASEDKSKLCSNSSTECSELYEKFAFRHINALFISSYLFTIVIALATAIHFERKHHSQEIQFAIEEFVESHLSKHKMEHGSSSIHG